MKREQKVAHVHHVSVLNYQLPGPPPPLFFQNPESVPVSTECDDSCSVLLPNVNSSELLSVETLQGIRTNQPMECGSTLGTKITSANSQGGFKAGDVCIINVYKQNTLLLKFRP